ncbi:FAD-binding oxidoreductase [Williamsia soli]|uniref:FAD-binding oxidoreductase n=1 Tax=Williamsia soli TaxID=364929 RepID=UPI001A9D1371|nr:FAD-linked oxidase C-terminal domain-containing protein [Williamsia soli]
MLAHRSDHALFTSAGVPVAVVFPTSTHEVSAVCAIAFAHAVPIVPRGAGTGLSGGANAVDGCIVLCVDRMDSILEIDEVNGLAVVQPGVINGVLSAAVRAQGLFYPPDPGSQETSSIGGNVATNAGGLCCVKYGVTRDYVLELEVVLPDGRVLRTGRRSRKGVAGLDLTSLFTGSEGILGVITQITVRLLRAPSTAVSTVLAEFASLEAAGLAVQQIVAGCTPSLLEIMDSGSLSAVNQWKQIDISPDVAAVLIARSDSPGGTAQADMAVIEKACHGAGAVAVYSTDDLDEGEMLVQVRRMAGTAMERLGSVLVDDVAIPISRLAEFLSGTQNIAARHRANVCIIGHAGDGNMHPSVIFDPQDAEQSATAMTTFEEIGLLGLELGGTITGEHGVGLLKADLLRTELGPVSLDVHRAIKAALDPRNIMNPGKVFSQ